MMSTVICRYDILMVDGGWLMVAVQITVKMIEALAYQLLCMCKKHF
jgi:hypothetical protein